MTERANILVVDDRPDKHVVYKAILGELDQNLFHVSSGEQALKQVLKRDFAVILLDVNMPGVDGLETAALIRRRKRSAHIPIIFITADYGDEARTAQGYALGAVDFMVSPIVPEVLRSKVRVFVELHLLAQQAKRQAEEHVVLTAERAARAAAEEANQRSAFMAGASAALGRSLAVIAVSRELPRLAIPFLADMSAVTMHADNDIEGARTEMAWIDPDHPGGLCSESVAAIECSWWREATTRVMESGKSERFDGPPPLRADRSASASRPEPLEIPSGATISTLVVLPLVARGRTLGAFTIGLSALAGRTYDADEIAMAADLAHRAAMALDNALLYKTIREHDRRKNEFLAMLAHELRNPLTPITNALYIMDQQGLDGEKLAWAKKVIGRQVRLLGRLVDDLLDVSRITQGKIDLKIEPVDVAEVMAAAVETARPLIDARQHAFTVTVPANLPPVNGDFARLAQILANLLNNAAKYTEPNGSIRLTAAQDGSEIVFRVRDSGMGIPAASLSAIFELFAQAERTLDRSQGGLGIGLTLVKRLVEMQGGSVSAYSAGHDQGSEFTVRLPSTAPAQTMAPAPSAADLSPRDSAHGSRVLVVDDNRDAAESMAVLLRMEGHIVDVAYDGPSALEAVQALHPNAVLLDIGLPGIDGYEVAARLRSMPGGTELLLVATSGYDQEEHRDRAARIGFDRHLVKPIDPLTITDLLAAGRPGKLDAVPENVVPLRPRKVAD